MPVASPATGVDFPARNNLFYPYDMQWLSFTSGHTGQDRLFGDDAFWVGMWRRWNESAIFQEWVDHPNIDAYWDAYNPSGEQYAKLQLPILTITGMYDGDQPGALAHYSRYMKAASVEARAPLRYTMENGPKPEFLRRPVAYYVSGHSKIPAKEQ